MAFSANLIHPRSIRIKPDQTGVMTIDAIVVITPIITIKSIN